MANSNSSIQPGPSLANWRLTPYSQWSFQNVRQLIPSADIAASHATKPLPSVESQSTDQLKLACIQGKTLASFLRESFSDSLVILHQGKKICQWQAAHCDSSLPHILFSVSKSITAMLTGILVEQGLLDVGKPLVYYLPATSGSAYEDCSLQQLLDMGVALDFEESYLDTSGGYRRYRDATGWNPVDQQQPGPGLEAFLYGLRKADHEHGEKFSYRSPNSDLLGLVVERVAGIPYAKLMSDLIWQPMGAGSDAYVTVDRHFLARAAGGICMTIDDLARFGQLILDRGSASHRSIIPESWISNTMTRGDRGAWQKGDFVEFLPKGCYRNQWYQIGDSNGSMMALGIHGQWLYLDPTTQLVVAKLSSQPEPVDEALDSKTLQVFGELSLALAG